MLHLYRALVALQQEYAAAVWQVDNCDPLDKIQRKGLAGDHLYGKLLFTWLLLVMPMMVSFFVLSFFPRGVLDEILNFIESVSEGFPSCSSNGLWH